MARNHPNFKGQSNGALHAAKGAVKLSRRETYSLSTSRLSHIHHPSPDAMGEWNMQVGKRGALPLVTAEAGHGRWAGEPATRECPADLGDRKCAQCYDLPEFEDLVARGAFKGPLGALPEFAFTRYAHQCAAGSLLSRDNLSHALREVYLPEEQGLPAGARRLTAKPLLHLEADLCGRLNQLYHNYRDRVPDAVLDAIHKELLSETRPTVFDRFDPDRGVPFTSYVRSSVWKSAAGELALSAKRIAASVGEDDEAQHEGLIIEHVRDLSNLRREPDEEDWADLSEEDGYRARFERLACLNESLSQEIIDLILNCFCDADGMTRVSEFGIEVLARAERQLSAFSVRRDDKFTNLPTRRSIAQDASETNSGRLEGRYLAEIDDWTAALPNMRPLIEAFVESAEALKKAMQARSEFKSTEVNWRTRLFGVVSTDKLKSLLKS